MSLVKNLRSVFFLPVLIILVGVPLLLLWLEGAHWFWGIEPPWSWGILLCVALLICAGSALMLHTARVLSQRGKSTLAPWDPTRKLVVQGVYRHVRNPMMLGVFCVLLGETLLFGARGILLWTLLFAIVNVIGVPRFEEPGLQERFGAQYALYKKNVPRWIPRLTPWELTGDEMSGLNNEHNG